MHTAWPVSPARTICLSRATWDSKAARKPGSALVIRGLDLDRGLVHVLHSLPLRGRQAVHGTDRGILNLRQDGIKGGAWGRGSNHTRIIPGAPEGCNKSNPILPPMLTPKGSYMIYEPKNWAAWKSGSDLPPGGVALGGDGGLWL